MHVTDEKLGAIIELDHDHLPDLQQLDLAVARAVEQLDDSCVLLAFRLAVSSGSTSPRLRRPQCWLSARLRYRWLRLRRVCRHGAQAGAYATVGFRTRGVAHPITPQQLLYNTVVYPLDTGAEMTY